MLRRAFAGGLTHGNRFYSEMTVEGEIRHRDYRSHYPSQQRTSTCPVGKFNLWSDGGTTLEELEELKKKYCLLFDVILTNPRIRDGVTLPVISESKARQGSIGLCHFVSDNGRVMRCEGTFCLSVTDLDFYWIEKQYDRDELYIGALYVAKRGVYPKYLRDSIDEFMFGKSDIKERIESETDYMKKLDLDTALLKSKNGLNGIYGMSATDPVRTTYTIDEAGVWHEERPEDIGAVLDKYYKNENNFNRFCLGVWCTASARDELLSEIERIESAGGIYLYCDTDSCFYASTPEVEEELERENLRRRKKSDEIGAFIETSSGKRVHYNQFCDEKENIRRFRFLHAKCYGYELKQKRNTPVARCKGSKRRSVYYSYSRIRVRNFKAVIAGVNAFEDATRNFSREQELWKLDNLRDGFVFERCGGTTSKYEDKAQIDVYYWNGQPQEVATWCIIKKTTKELNNQVKMIEKNVIYERR